MSTTKTNEFHVVGSGNLSKLTKFEFQIEEFILSSLMETKENEKHEKITSFVSVEKQKEVIGISISEKKLRQKLSDWNKEKMIVSASKIDLCVKSKKVCQNITASIKDDDNVIVIPTVKSNDLQGTFYITFVSKDNLKKEYSKNELKQKDTTKEKLYLDDIIKILGKDDFNNNIAKDNEKTSKIETIIKTLELLK